MSGDCEDRSGTAGVLEDGRRGSFVESCAMFSLLLGYLPSGL